MPQATEVRKIVVTVNAGDTTAQLKAISDQMGGINQNTKSLAQTFGFLTSAASAFLGGLGIRQLVEFSDEIQNLNNRYLALSGSQAQATQTLHQLQILSQETNSSLSATSDLYTKMSLALGAAHLSGTSLQEIMKTLVNSFRLSGSTADEAYSAVSSLALAFELGGLKGRELRTVLRQNQVLALALRKEFGGELFSAANNGFITVSKLMEVLYKNMGDINARAALMSATFSQSLTKAIDAFKIKIFEVNEALGASSGFAGAIKLATDNMGTIVTVGTIIAVSTLPSIITQVYKLGAALLTLSPAAAALTGGLAVGLASVVGLFGNSTDIGDLINQMAVGFARMEGILDDFIAKTYEARASFHNLIGNTDQGFTKLGQAARQSAKDHYAHAQALEIEYDATKALGEQQAATAAAAARHAADLASLQKNFKPDLTASQVLAQLNSEFRSGAITVEQYNEKLQAVDIKQAQIKFRDGHEDLSKLNDAFRAFNAYNLNQQLKNGVITFTEFNEAVRAQKLDKLKEDLESGKISLQDFNHELASTANSFSTSGAFRTGLQDYVTAIGTTTQQVAGLITNTFKSLEDQLVNFVKRGQFNFAQFTQGILDDLLRIIIRMSIIQPLATGLLGAFTPTATAGPTPGAGITANGAQPTINAHGNVYGPGGLHAFATGGVVSKPTLFGFSGGTGLMGEKGAEAILPLSRGSGGDLGVKASVTPVNINIINNNGSEVSQTETTGPSGDRQIDIMITNKVREAIGSGKFDKSFKQSYGLNRRGN